MMKSCSFLVYTVFILLGPRGNRHEHYCSILHVSSVTIPLLDTISVCYWSYSFERTQVNYVSKRCAHLRINTQACLGCSLRLVRLFSDIYLNRRIGLIFIGPPDNKQKCQHLIWQTPLSNQRSSPFFLFFCCLKSMLSQRKNSCQKQSVAESPVYDGP